MNITFVSDTPNPGMIGGGEYAIYRYAEALADRGHKVRVYGQFRRPFMQGLDLTPGLSILLRGGIERRFKGAGKLNQCWDVLHTRMVVVPQLKKTDPMDCIIGYQRRSSIKAMKLGGALNVPVAHIAFEPPTSMEEALGEQYKRVMIGRLAREWDGVRDAYRASHGLFPLSRVVGDAVTAWSGMRCSEPVYAGVEAPDQAMEIKPEDRHILYIGRLDATKNVGDLIDAVARMASPPPLVIVGRGYDEEELKARAAAAGIACRFVGLVSDKEKWTLLRQSIFLVFPTSLEGFGMPPGEALSCGKPAVCSDIPILREVYGDAVEYYPLHDVPALSHTMEKLVRDAGYRRARGMAGREYVLSRYTWRHCAERIETGIRNLLERAGA
ncbi:MAG: glycosyltransferase family 4 protein [Verrucomicrobia bacterium]|nr:glycosyltransferase family 4 protein [Verrucomicrobiota bacterium]